jgi:hypothetical protein
MPKRKAKTTSLWPSTLQHAAGVEFAHFLRDQAEDLKRLVNNAFDVSVETRIVESVIIYNFVIRLVKQDYRYVLFSLRTIGDEFPARIVAPHLPEPRQVIPVNSKDELEEELRKMFHDESTLRVVTRLAEESQNDVEEGE